MLSKTLNPVTGPCLVTFLSKKKKKIILASIFKLVFLKKSNALLIADQLLWLLIELKVETDLVPAFEWPDSWYLDNKIKLAIFFLIQYLYVRHFKHALLLPFHPGIVGWMWMYKPMVSILMYLKRKTVLSFYFHCLCPSILEPRVKTGGTYSALHPSCSLSVGSGRMCLDFTWADDGWMRLKVRRW